MRIKANQSRHDDVRDHGCKASENGQWSSSYSINDEEADTDGDKLPNVQNTRHDQGHLVVQPE